MANAEVLRRVGMPASTGPRSALHPYREDSHRRLDIVEISEFEWLRERNGRAGCADGHRLPSIRRKTHECGERTKAAGTKDSEYLAKNSRSLEPRSRRSARTLARDYEEPCHRSKKQRPRTKEHAYIQRSYYVSRPYPATEPSRRRRYVTYMGSPK